MRVIGQLPHAECVITLFQWNGKYLIKLEQGMVEQTYKVDELELTGQEAIEELLDSTFMQEALGRFEEMHKSLAGTMGRNA